MKGYCILGCTPEARLSEIAVGVTIRKQSFLKAADLKSCNKHALQSLTRQIMITNVTKY